MSSGHAPGHPVHLLSRQLLPIVVLVLYPPIRDAVVVHLAREGPTARFLHDGGNWKQSKRVFTGRGCERFREEVCCTSGKCGLYRFHHPWKTSSCGLWKLLEISVSAIHCDGLP